MGYETLAGFRESVNLALEGDRQTNERLDRWVNDAHIELFAELDIQGRRTCGTTGTVKDQREYLTPTAMIASLVLRDTTNKRRLIRTSVENFKLLDEARTGPPKRYMRVDNLFFLYPLPDAIYTLQLFYLKEPALFTLAVDKSELPAMYDRVIHLIALRNALIDLEKEERATFIFQVAQNKLAKLPTEEWLESQNPREGIQIARSFRDLQKDPREGVDETFQGRILL